MPQIKSIVETSLYVDDMPRARGFYEGLGLRLLRADERMCAFDVGGCSILLLFTRGSTLTTITMPGGTIPPHDGHGPLHIAFAVAADDLSAWEGILQERNIPVEARADWSRGGRSLYFRDPDGHLLELATPGLWETY
jgi:catechol 2,3-dioxygenase-like lactoylglutathione lyase family enzyme